MRVTALETLRPATQPNVLFVRLHSDDGLVGLGESFFGARAVEAYLHESVAEVLLASPDVAPDRIASLLRPYVGYQGAGAETRGNAAVDLALWDLLGQRTGVPLVRLVVGPVRDRIGIYNTCAGSGYIRTSSRQESRNWGLPTTEARQSYDDLDAFLHRPAELAPELWDRRTATRICDALAPYQPYWVEDPLRGDSTDAYDRLHHDVDVTIAAGETCDGRPGFAPLLTQGAIDVATVDVQWTGGVTVARKVARLADTYGVPVAPHDCTGPRELRGLLPPRAEPAQRSGPGDRARFPPHLVRRAGGGPSGGDRRNHVPHRRTGPRRPAARGAAERPPCRTDHDEPLAPGHRRPRPTWTRGVGRRRKEQM